MSELITLAFVRGMARDATLKFVRELIESRSATVVWVDEPFHQAAKNLLGERKDKDYSLCDAVSFVLMKLEHLLDALTTDYDFEQKGFRRLLQPE